VDVQISVGMWVYAHHSVTGLERGSRATLRLHFQGALARLLGRATRRINDECLGMEARGLKRRSEERVRAAHSDQRTAPGS
jgi:hypothetical protein